MYTCTIYSNAPREEKPRPPAEQEEVREESHHEKERPTGSRMSKRAGSVRSNESSDSGSGGHRKSPLKPRKRSSQAKGGTSPVPGHAHDDAKSKSGSEQEGKPAGPVK